MEPKIVYTCLRSGFDHTDCEKGIKQEICENKNCFCGAPKKVEFLKNHFKEPKEEAIRQSVKESAEDMRKMMKQPVTISSIIEEMQASIQDCLCPTEEPCACYCEGREDTLDRLRHYLEAVVDEMVLQKKLLMDKWTLEHATIGLQEEDMRNVGFNEAVDKLNAKREEIRK